MNLPQQFLEELVAELDGESVVGILLGGSYARGEAGPYSDVDIAVFVPDSSHAQRKRFFYRANRLVSVATKSVESIRCDMKRPQAAIWLVPGLRQRQSQHRRVQQHLRPSGRQFHEFPAHHRCGKRHLTPRRAVGSRALCAAQPGREESQNLTGGKCRVHQTRHVNTKRAKRAKARRCEGFKSTGEARGGFYCYCGS